MEEGVNVVVLIVVLFPVLKMLKSIEWYMKRHLGILPGQQRALVKQQFDELSANESETYGFNFP